METLPQRASKCTRQKPFGVQRRCLSSELSHSWASCKSKATPLSSIFKSRHNRIWRSTLKMLPSLSSWWWSRKTSNSTSYKSPWTIRRPWSTTRSCIKNVSSTSWKTRSTSASKEGAFKSSKPTTDRPGSWPRLYATMAWGWVKRGRRHSSECPYSRLKVMKAPTAPATGRAAPVTGRAAPATGSKMWRRALESVFPTQRSWLKHTEAKSMWQAKLANLQK